MSYNGVPQFKGPYIYDGVKYPAKDSNNTDEIVFLEKIIHLEKVSARSIFSKDYLKMILRTKMESQANLIVEENKSNYSRLLYRLDHYESHCEKTWYGCKGFAIEDSFYAIKSKK